MPVLKVTTSTVGQLNIIRPCFDGQEIQNLFSTNQSEIDRLLMQHGALLFRGFDVSSDMKFHDFIENLPTGALDYVDGNSPRTKLLGKVYTSTEYPSEYELSMHNELSYSRNWPSKLFFCCVIAPVEGGSTLIADCRKVLADLDPDIVEQFSKKQVKYTRYLHGGFGVGPSWQQTFEVESKTAVEGICKNLEISFEWDDFDGIKLSQIGPGILEHRITGEQVWFNQADQFHISNLPEEVQLGIECISEGNKKLYPTYSYFGDGSEINPELFISIREVFKRHTIVFQWEKGDLLLVDNVLMAHGRSAFSCERKILVSMI
jgi:alpha-ketoglutarate-dependent taurine dioxygenase